MSCWMVRVTDALLAMLVGLAALTIAVGLAVALIGLVQQL